MAEQLDSISTSQAVRRTYARRPITIAQDTEEIVDVRGAGGLVAYFSGATSCTATPVADDEGTAIDGASAGSLTSGTRIAIAAHFYEVAAVDGPVTLLVIG